MKTAIYDQTKRAARCLGAVLLIVGTAIGGGMLALPLVTAPSGFAPSILIFVLTWSAMTFTAFLLLECSFATKNSSNLISMSEQILGAPGKVITWIAYLLLLYSLVAAYISGMSSLLSGVFSRVVGSAQPLTVTAVGLILITVLIIAKGIALIDRLNRFFALAGAVCFLLLLLILSPHVTPAHFSHMQFGSVIPALPLLTTAFGFHIIIPTLINYLDYDLPLIRRSLWIGSLIPLILYLIWQFDVVGVLPRNGAMGLQAIAQSSDQLTVLVEALSRAASNPSVGFIASLFFGLAIVTSLLGVALSLWDFLSDGLAFSKKLSKPLVILAATFVPPSCLVLFFPSVFTILLGYAGIFVAILLGWLPIAMCWQIRRQAIWASGYRIPGGSIALGAGALFFLAVIVIQLKA